MKSHISLGSILLVLVVLSLSLLGFGQGSGRSQYYLQVQTATLAVNNQVTLTLAAPGNNKTIFVCHLFLGVSSNNTGQASTNQVFTSTNFNSFQHKYSMGSGANNFYDRVFDWGDAETGCVKSAAAATATTFVSPAALTNAAFTITAAFYVADN